MVPDRTDLAQTQAAEVSVPWPKADRQPRSSYRYSFCSQDWHPLGVSAAGDGLWKRYDLLAATPRLAKGRRMGPTPPDLIDPPSRCRQDRLVSRSCGFGFCAGCFWGAHTGPNPTDRRKAGSKHHVITDANGIPLSAHITAANRHDVTQLLPLVDAIPPIAGKPGRPRCRPDRVQGDRAYDSQPHREELSQRGIEPVLAKRNTEHGSGLGVFRWPVERTLSWLHQYRRLRVRYERRPDIHQAFLKIGCALICFKALVGSFC